MNLSKSKFCNAMQCAKMLWLYENMPYEAKEESNEAVMDNGNLVHEVARSLLGDYHLIDFNEDLSVMINKTQELLKKNDKIVIAEASFVNQHNFCSVDLLKKDHDKYTMYEVKGSTKVKDIFILDLAYQYYVLSSLGYQIDTCNIVTLNSEYIRCGSLDLNALFNISDYTKEIKGQQELIKEKINFIHQYMQTKNEPEDDIDNKCFKPYMCPFFDYCTRHLTKENVFNLRRILNKQKIKLYKEGIISYQDLLKADINEMAKEQIIFELDEKEDKINKKKIAKFLNTLSMPLYFLDFETFQSPIPKYDNTSPYEQIPFQYSLHYYENNRLKHKEFLAEGGIDPRYELAKSLVNDIPLNVCTLAYNMSFEKSVIKNLASTYPEFHDHLMNIHDHIKDLMIPFKDRDYYNKAMQGSYSIKYVLPALFPNEDDLDYHNLDLIHNGQEAMNAYSNLEVKTKEELIYIRERLLKYCELDTYAMVKVYQKLKEVVK